MMAKRWALAALLAMTIAIGATVGTDLRAQSTEPAPATAPAMGPETNLPIPRFVSLKANEANIRRGPSMTHRVDWVFRHPGQPLIVVAEYGHWRRVVDRDGFGGWVHYALLSGTRTVIVDVDMIDLRSQPSLTANVRARAERGVIAKLDDCADGWCEIKTGGQRGWVLKADLWGVDLPTQTASASMETPTAAPAEQTTTAVTQ